MFKVIIPWDDLVLLIMLAIVIFIFIVVPIVLYIIDSIYKKIKKFFRRQK